ncbi:MAG: hypothetical protein CMO34_00950 [Verrucomicrobia bacterium]|nr:hypothetical protein [Verrucomicrobiota bacterium]
MHKFLFVFLLITVSLLNFNCKSRSQVAETSADPEVNYEAMWDEVEEMEKKGLGKKIIEQTNLILEKAINENETNHIFKALSIRSKHLHSIEEASSYKIINSFEEKLDYAAAPLKQLLSSATAELYHQYLQQNRWKLNERSERAEHTDEDFRTWSAETLEKRIDLLYLMSVKDVETSIETPLKDYDYILNIPSTEVLPPKMYDYRPSLYDLLVDRALRHFELRSTNTFRPSITKTDVSKWFSPIEEYCTLPLGNDSSAFSLVASIYQSSICHHQARNETAAMVDFDLQRLNYFRRQVHHPSTDSIFLDALNKMKSTSPEEHQSEVNLAIAQFYFEMGQRYYFAKEDESHRWHLNKALKVCQEFLNDPLYGNNFQQINRAITQANVHLISESVYTEEESILYYVEYKNVKKLHFRLIKKPHELPNKTQLPHYDNLSKLLKIPALKVWTEQLPEETDHQTHATELFLKAQALGNYYLLVSTDETFKPEQSKIAFMHFQVSNLSYLSRQTRARNELEFHLLERKTGENLHNAKLELYRNVRDKNYTNSWIKEDSKTPNAKGMISLQAKERGAVRFFIHSAKDTLVDLSSHYLYPNNTPTNAQINSHLFTDRKLYRPGQTVHFKGIVTSTEKDNKKALANKDIKVGLYNKNGELVSSMELTTNAFGSYHGSFDLPLSGLNGNFRLQDNFSVANISVEAYKRPTFEVLFDSLDQSVHLNTLVNIRGRVQAFSGMPLNDCKLTYRIERRNIVYPVDWYYRSYFPPSKPIIVASGGITSDASGKFSFDFLPQGAKKKNQITPNSYSYTITIEATHLSGETQFGKKEMQLSDQALFLSMNLKQHTTLDELKALMISAKNIEGKAVNTKVKLELFALEAPQKAFKSKYWGTTDRKHIPKKQYAQFFPSFSQENIKGIEDYPKGTLIASSSVMTNQALDLFRQIKQGAYLLKVSAKDANGKLLELEKRILLHDLYSNKTALSSFFYLHPLQEQGDVGDTVSMLIGSSLNNIHLHCEVLLKNKVVESFPLLLNNEQKTLSFPIKEEYRGNFTVQFYGVYDNRTIHHQNIIKVPYTNKKLDVKVEEIEKEYGPGDKITWTVRIKDAKNRLRDTEILAGMYDKSLDKISPFKWSFSVFQERRTQLPWRWSDNFKSQHPSWYGGKTEAYTSPYVKTYPSLNWFGFHLGHYPMHYRSVQMMQADRGNLSNAPLQRKSEEFMAADDNAAVSKESPEAIHYRSDFNETAFFFPMLRTDKEGKAELTFELPESIGKWKLQLLAHSKDLSSALITKEIVSKKALSVQLNAPRFMRSGDTLHLNAVINNDTKAKLRATANIQFLDAHTETPLDILEATHRLKKVDVPAQQNKKVSWTIVVPEGMAHLMYRLSANATDVTDGEEGIIPILSNKSLVTESVPLNLNPEQSKKIVYSKFINSLKDATIKQKSYTLEFTSNPAWYAVQALPYLSSPEHPSSEQIFKQYFANKLARMLVEANPQIERIYAQWKSSNAEALQSKLQSNEELKSIHIQESPWQQKALSETAQKRRLAALFNSNQNDYLEKEALEKLSANQLPNGAWSWFKGMRPNRYITQDILSGLGQLVQLKVLNEKEPMIQDAISYLDDEMKTAYLKLKEKHRLEEHRLSGLEIQYLYCRSYFGETVVKHHEAFQFYIDKAQSQWVDANLQDKASIALSFKRLYGDADISHKILNSLIDHALLEEDNGMYWKANTAYSWKRSQIEVHALMIELFEQMNAQQEYIDGLKKWLLKNKQSHVWESNASTAAACYALLMNGDLLSTTSMSTIAVGGTIVSEDNDTEAGSGYLKKTWSAGEINARLGEVDIQHKGSTAAWGALHWQYEQASNLVEASAHGPLILEKSMYKVAVENNKEVLLPIVENQAQLGDRLRIQLRVKTDQDFEFVHLKDERAAAFEPTAVLSGHQWKEGLGYYFSTKDASTHFFIDYLPKGIYLLSYDVWLTQEGRFTSGLSSIQSQYAPEFNAHSAAPEIKVLAP